MALADVKRRTMGVLGLTAVLGLALFAIGLGSGDDRTALFYAMVGPSLFIGALAGILRLRAADTESKAGTAGIQHNWITLSLSLAFLSLVPATFFRASDAIKIAAGIIAAILILVPAWGLYDTRKATGVPLSI